MIADISKELISSRSNKTVKHLKTLGLARNRQREGHFLVEGVRIIEEVLELNCCMEMLIVTPAAATEGRVAALAEVAAERQIEIMWVADRVIDYLSETKTSQGVMALVRPVPFEESDLTKGQLPIILVAHLLQDPGNLGAIIRVAEAAGIGGVVTTPGTVDFYNPKTLRATMGSIFRLPAIRVDSLEVFVNRYKKKGYQVVAAMVSARMRYFELNFSKPTVLLVGQEASGLPAEAYRLTDFQVSIPMATMIDSLNVAGAAGIVLYEAVRQKLAP